MLEIRKNYIYFELAYVDGLECLSLEFIVDFAISWLQMLWNSCVLHGFTILHISRAPQTHKPESKLSMLFADNTKLRMIRVIYFHTSYNQSLWYVSNDR